MSEIYILSELGKLGKKDEAFVFYTPEGTSTILYPFKIEQFIIIGKVSISGEAFRLLARHKISIAFLSSNGYFNSRLTYASEKNVLLRQQQFRLLDDKEASLKIARQIVCGKIKNQISFMQRIKRKGSKNDGEIELGISQTKKILHDAERIKSIDSLRGLEGVASKNYFNIFKTNIKPQWASFPCRSKNPPKSNVNAVLSFLYTVLMTRITSAIEALALDPMVGTLHSLHYGSNALAFDLAEEFRVPIADTLCCSLFNLGILSPDDFRICSFSEKSDDFPVMPSADGFDGTVDGVLLTENGLRKTIKAFEEKLNKPRKNNQTNYRDIIILQIQKYKQMLKGEIENYAPYYYK